MRVSEAAKASPDELHSARVRTQAGQEFAALDNALLADEVAATFGYRASDFTHDVAIVGLGYVGLPTALAFHATGHRVIGIDVNAARLDNIRRGRVDLLKSDRERLTLAAADAEAFQLTPQTSRLSRARTVIICVPTPVDDHLVPDLSILRRACESVVTHAVPGQVLILTSTTYVGSTRDLLAQPLSERGLRPGEDIFVVFSPERIDPGNTAHPHQTVPRVIGGITPECGRQAAKSMSRYGTSVHPVSSAGAAEMTKLLENTFRAVNIAFVNEVSDACRVLDLDVAEVIDAAATKPFGFMRFTPGPGVGGHCIPCDPHYLLWQLRAQRLQAPVIEQAMAAIAGRPGAVVGRIREVLSDAGASLRGARVLVVGVAYKADVEDLRESPALEILDRLERAGAVVAYHDQMVPRVTTPGGSVLHSVAEPGGYAADLVFVHTLHGGQDVTWMEAERLVLDATYRLRQLRNRVVL